MWQGPPSCSVFNTAVPHASDPASVGQAPGCAWSLSPALHTHCSRSKGVKPRGSVSCDACRGLRSGCWQATKEPHQQWPGALDGWPEPCWQGGPRIWWCPALLARCLHCICSQQQQQRQCGCVEGACLNLGRLIAAAEHTQLLGGQAQDLSQGPRPCTLCDVCSLE